MPEFFKPEITEKRGKDDVEIKESTDFDKISGRSSDGNLINEGVTNLRKNVLRLNDKLKKAQGILGTSVNGLSDREIAVAAKLVTARLNTLGTRFLNEAKKLSFGDFSREANLAFDRNKADLINGHLIGPLNTYINSELDTVLETVDAEDADEERVAAKLNPTPSNLRQGIAALNEGARIKREEQEERDRKAR